MAGSLPDPVAEDALLAIDFGSGGMPGRSLAETASDPEPREPVSRAGLARLLVGTIHECSSGRAAYHVCAGLLATRTRELADLRASHARLIEEYRAHRVRHEQVPV